MKIVDFNIKKHDGKLLIFISIEQEISDNRICYRQLNNIIYKIKKDYCITNRRGTPIALVKTLKDCAEFLSEECMKDYTLEAEISFSDKHEI